MYELDDIAQTDKDHDQTIYHLKFELALIEETREFYSNEAKTILPEYSTPDYIDKAYQRYEEENRRADNCFQHKICRSHKTKEKILEIYLDEMISKNALQILEKDSGLFDMLQNNKFENLNKLFGLFKRSSHSMNIF